MAAILPLLVALLVAHHQVRGLESAHCSADNASKFHFSVSSRRNATGHRLVGVKILEDVCDAVEDAGIELAVDVEQAHFRCNHSEALSSTAVTEGVSVPRFLSGYQRIPGFGEYKVHGSYVKWALANRTCVDEGAHLVVMETKEEMDAVNEMVRSAGPSFAHYLLWTGVYRDDSSSPWMTLLGRPLGSSALWWPGDPLQSGDCVRFETSSSIRGYANTKCEYISPFLCEK